MEQELVDELTRLLATIISRRQVLKAGAATAFGAMISGSVTHVTNQMKLSQRGIVKPADPLDPTSVNWTPLGPSTITYGPTNSNPPWSGRITCLAVGPGATRVYAGAANGGVWYIESGWDVWESLDVPDSLGDVMPASDSDSLAVGAIAVSFGASKDDDLIYIGTGESSVPDNNGVGIRRFGPPAGGGVSSWSLELRIYPDKA